MQFLAGIGFTLLCFALVAAFAPTIEEDYETETYDGTLDTALSFLVICHLQPNNVDHAELEIFLKETGALEEN